MRFGLTYRRFVRGLKFGVRRTMHVHVEVWNNWSKELSFVV